MAIKLITNYCKRLGLPGYSSHQFSVSVETELTTTADIPAEAERLYGLLQSNVDQQMQTTGFVPPGTYGMEMPNGTNGGSPGINVSTSPLDGRWKCSDRQRDLILRIVDEHQLNKHSVEELAFARFGHGVRLLNKLEASGLIDELLANHGGGGNNRPPPAAPARTNGSAYNGAQGRRAA